MKNIPDRIKNKIFENINKCYTNIFWELSLLIKKNQFIKKHFIHFTTLNKTLTVSTYLNVKKKQFLNAFYS